jgi:O-antigen ligase
VRERSTAVVLVVVVAFYAATIGWRGVLLIADGRPAAVALGVGVVLVPVVAVLAMVPLVRLARDGQRMMAQARATGAHGAWGAELDLAEQSRVEGNRGAEQRHFRAAVRAWRSEQAHASD